jgi:hypothetical protein
MGGVKERDKMKENIENKIVELGKKYIPLLDQEIELATQQLDLTRRKHFDREKNKSFVKRMERE